MNSSQVKTCGARTNPSRCGEQLPYVSEDLELHGEPPLHEVSDIAEPIAQHTSDESRNVSQCHIEQQTCAPGGAMQQAPKGSTATRCPAMDDTMHGESPPHEASNLLATADTDNGPCEALPPHGSTGQSSECVEALAPWHRRQVDDVDPQECGESPTHDACDAPGVCGEH